MDKKCSGWLHTISLLIFGNCMNCSSYNNKIEFFLASIFGIFRASLALVVIAICFYRGGYSFGIGSIVIFCILFIFLHIKMDNRGTRLK